MMIFNKLTFFKHKLLLKLYKKLIHLFKFKLRKPVFIKSLQIHRRKKPTHNKSTNLPKFLSVFRSLRRTRKIDQITDMKSFSEAEGYQIAPYSSPITPAYIRMSVATSAIKKEVLDKDDEVEDACRSFEKYLTEMIVEEGKIRDLVDVEELLYCLNNLKCPVFTGLISRFYGELCKDLFSRSKTENDIETSKGLLM